MDMTTNRFDVFMVFMEHKCVFSMLLAQFSRFKVALVVSES